MKFSVPEMSCGHCSSAIQKAISELDRTAIVACDLATRVVVVETSVPQSAIAAAIKHAGYDSEPVAP